jgi:hypothetical protein
MLGYQQDSVMVEDDKTAKAASAPHKNSASGMLRTAIQIVTYPIAALTAYFVGRTEMRRGLYKIAVTSKSFAEKQTSHREAIAKIFQDARDGIPVTDGPEQFEKLNKAYRQTLKAEFQGIGFKNTSKYWKALHPNQKVSTLMFAGGAAGVVITTLLAVANNKGLMDRITRADRDGEEHCR